MYLVYKVLFWILSTPFYYLAHYLDLIWQNIKKFIENLYTHLRTLIEDVIYSVLDLIFATIRLCKLVFAPIAGYLSGLMHLPFVQKMRYLIPNLKYTYITSAFFCFVLCVCIGYSIKLKFL